MYKKKNIVKVKRNWLKKKEKKYIVKGFESIQKVFAKQIQLNTSSDVQIDLKYKKKVLQLWFS